jgi:hypothetical protein
MYSLVLHGQLNDARELLAQHPDSHDQPGSYDVTYILLAIVI